MADLRSPSPARQKAVAIHGFPTEEASRLGSMLARNGWGIDESAPISLIDGQGGLARVITELSGIARQKISRVILYPVALSDSLQQLIAHGGTHFLRTPANDAEILATLALARGNRDESRQGNRDDAPRRSDRDSLTGLISERAMSQRINAYLPQPVSLLLITIARFDVVNTAYGSDAADAVLRGIARRIESLLVEIDGVEALVARMPGAQFAVSLFGTLPVARCRLLAEAILDVIEQPFSSGGEVIRLGGRLAVVASEQADRTARSIFRRATVLLAQGRSDDEDAIQIAIGNEQGTAPPLRSLHADLRAALAHDEIEILFQPQIGIASGKVEGVEALARWTHPELGPIGAATLFAVAQQSDYLKALSAHCQARALKLAGQWGAELAHLRLAVNVLAADISRPRFLREFLEMLDESGFPRTRLTVEITETGAMADLARSARVLGQLRAAGLRVAIDDFGTGYSSLAWLKELPADYIKLDKGLTGEIGGSARDAVVVRGVIGMARSLGLSVIAEGVESDGQLALLAREGCTLYQGFLHSPAMNSMDLAKLVKS